MITLNHKDDNNAIFRAAAVDAGKIHLTNCSLYTPLVIPSDIVKLNLYKTIKFKTSLDVGYRMRQCDTITVPKSTIIYMETWCKIFT